MKKEFTSVAVFSFLCRRWIYPSTADLSELWTESLFIDSAYVFISVLLEIIWEKVPSVFLYIFHISLMGYLPEESDENESTDLVFCCFNTNVWLGLISV